MAKAATASKKQAAPEMSSGNSISLGKMKFTITAEEKICLALLALLVILVHSIRSNFLLIPFERDEGIYTYFGVLALDGKVPYKDYYEFKFPGMFYFYALMVKLFGATVEGMHTGFMYLNILTLVLAYFASRNLFSPVAGILSATTFAFVSLTPNLSGFTVQAEHGVALFITLGIYFYSLARRKERWFIYLLMGISLGLAVMIKTSAVFLAFWGALIITSDFLFGKKPRELKPFLINLLSYAAGGVAMVITFVTVVYVQGAFDEMIFWVFDIAKFYVNMIPLEEGIKYFKYTRDAIVQHHKFFWIHAVAAVGICLFRPVDLKLKIMAFALLACSFFTIVPGYYFYGHYWIQTIPGLAILAGLSYHCFMTVVYSKMKEGKFNLRYVYLGVFVMLTFGHVNGSRSYYFHPNYDLILRQVYGNNPFPEAWEIGKYINSISKPEDQIVLIGSEPQIYIYTNKRCPSRHAYFTTLVTSVPMHKEWQREFVRDTEKAKPRYVVFFKHPISLLVQANTDSYVFDWANKYLTENYRVIGLVDMPDGAASTYVLNRDQVNTYKPVGNNQIYVFERNPEPTTTVPAPGN